MAAAWLWEVMVESHGDLLFEALFNLFLLKYPEKLEEASVEEICTYIPLTLYFPASQLAIGSHQQAKAFGPVIFIVWSLLVLLLLFVCACVRMISTGDALKKSNSCILTNIHHIQIARGKGRESTLSRKPLDDFEAC